MPLSPTALSWYDMIRMPQIEIAAEKLFFVGGLPITNTLITSWVVVCLLVLVALVVRTRFELVPRGLQNLIEAVVEAALKLMEGVLGSREKAERYLPLVATLFLFILTSNWLGVLPGIGSVGFRALEDGAEKFVPLFRSAASDLNFTLALAVLVVLAVNIFGSTAVGIRPHLSRYFTLKNPLQTFVGLLELISEFAKMISFSFRLFGNIFAGEVLLIITGFLMPFLAPLPFLGLEIFVGFIQALVFAMLTTVFLSIAVAQH